MQAFRPRPTSASSHRRSNIATLARAYLKEQHTMNPVSAADVQLRTESFLANQLSTSLSEVAKAVFGLDPSRLDRAQLGTLISCLKRNGWRERRDHVTRAKFWRASQEAARTPISPAEDIGDNSGRQWPPVGCLRAGDANASWLRPLRSGQRPAS